MMAPMTINRKSEMSVLQAIDNEVGSAIEEALLTLYEISQPNFCLLIARAGVNPIQENIEGVRYLMDNVWDVYHDETRQQFYLNYLNANYSKGVLNYTENDGLDKLYIEMMIYSHLWDSQRFLKDIYRISTMIAGKPYDWELDLEDGLSYKKMKDEIITPLKAKGLKLGEIIDSCYSSHIRNSFAHSLFDIDIQPRVIHLRSKHIKNYEDSRLTFEAFQDKFLHSIFLCYCLTNIIDINRLKFAKANKAITDVFEAPNGKKMQLFGKVMESKGKFYPHFHGTFIVEE